jgi:hypothetical protein
MTVVLGGMEPPAAMIVAINPRPNQTPGPFAGIALVRHPSVQRAAVADTTARSVGRFGTAALVTATEQHRMVSFVNVTFFYWDIWRRHIFVKPLGRCGSATEAHAELPTGRRGDVFWSCPLWTSFLGGSASAADSAGAVLYLLGLGHGQDGRAS